MTRTLATFAALLALAGATPAQTEESLLRTYDLRAMMPRFDASRTWSQSLLLPPVASPSSELPSIEQYLEYGELSSGPVHDLLTQVLGDELRREAGREVILEGSELTVMAPESLQEQVRSVIEGLEAALSGSVPVRVDVLTLPDGAGELPAAGTLADAEAERLVATLIAAGARHESHVLELSTGRTAVSDSYRHVPFLFDYDVEIAQASAIFLPVMVDARIGSRIVLRGVPAAGGIALSVLLQRSELLGEIATRPLRLMGRVSKAEGGPGEPLPGPGGVQTPEVLVRGLAFDTFLPEGRAVALTLEATLGAARTREVILLRRIGGGLSGYVVRPIPRTNRTLIALDAELFRAPRLRVDASPVSDDYGVVLPSVVAHFDGEPSGFLLEWLKARFAIYRSFGPWIVIVTDPAWDRDAAAQLDRLVKSLGPAPELQDVTLELRSGGGGGGGGGARPARVRLPLLSGSSAGIVLGRGTTAVTGYGVEVAQGAAVPDPRVTPVFEGIAVALSIEGTTCELSGLAQLFDGPIESVDSGYDAFGPIDRPAPRVLRFDERLVLPEGRAGPVRVGAGSERADQLALALELSVTAAVR